MCTGNGSLTECEPKGTSKIVEEVQSSSDEMEDALLQYSGTMRDDKESSDNSTLYEITELAVSSRQDF